MCRNIKTLANFAPPATDEEIRASALQFVRKLSGTTRPSRANEAVFNQAVEEVTAVAHRLVHSLTTTRHRATGKSKSQKARERRGSASRESKHCRTRCDVNPAWSLAVCADTLLRVSRPAPEAGECLDVWCLHGVGESGIPFFPLLGSEVARRHRIVVPDLPGFGASPPLEKGAATFDRMVTHVQQLVAAFSGERRIALVGHSIGAMIATEVARPINARVQALISIEGNLTPADAYLTGRAAAHSDPGAYIQELLERIGAEAAAGEPGAAGLLASLHFADPATTWELARTAAARSTADRAGADFAAASCRKHYHDGERSLSAEARKLLAQHEIQSRAFPGVGHWLMVAAPDPFHRAILEDLSNLRAW